ncbi:SGNH/GDSL hydrolase family protein [Actinomadura sp. 21ATH]|uniref:SGNH/GDSL hydrolase family protein n=1 Tax=Actinomadura sp. 21ATH TaxID=1735444 RepID=UPI0035C0C514
MKKRITIALGVALCAVLGATGLVGYLTFLRSPANTPADACESGRAGTGRPRLVAAGASMTQGTLGADWVGAIRERYPRYEVVNAGINGDTSADLRERVDSDIVACRPAAVALLVGTNDVRGEVPLERYRANLTAVVERVKATTGARVALLSLPPLGEDLNAPINRVLAGYNAAIKDIAARTRIDYLPVNERMAELLGRSGRARQGYDFSFFAAFTAAAQHYLLGRDWDRVAEAAGRELLVDHIHLSDKGGAIVTGLVGPWLASA